MIKTGKSKEAIGISVAMKFGGILVKNLPKARNEIYSFFAGCTKWDNGKEVEIEEIKHLKPSAAVKLIKDFTKTKDISDFFVEVCSLFNMESQEEQAKQKTQETDLKDLKN